MTGQSDGSSGSRKHGSHLVIGFAVSIIHDKRSDGTERWLSPRKQNILNNGSFT